MMYVAFPTQWICTERDRGEVECSLVLSEILIGKERSPSTRGPRQWWIDMTQHETSFPYIGVYNIYKRKNTNRVPQKHIVRYTKFQKNQTNPKGLINYLTYSFTLPQSVGAMPVLLHD